MAKPRRRDARAPHRPRSRAPRRPAPPRTTPPTAPPRSAICSTRREAVLRVRQQGSTGSRRRGASAAARTPPTPRRCRAPHAPDERAPRPDLAREHGEQSRSRARRTPVPRAGPRATRPACDTPKKRVAASAHRARDQRAAGDRAGEPAEGERASPRDGAPSSTARISGAVAIHATAPRSSGGKRERVEHARWRSRGASRTGGVTRLFSRAARPSESLPRSPRPDARGAKASSFGAVALREPGRPRDLRCR